MAEDETKAVKNTIKKNAQASQMTSGVLKQTSLQALNVTDSNETEQSKKDLIEAVKKKKSVKFIMDAQDPISA